jgi:magnesium transporter
MNQQAAASLTQDQQYKTLLLDVRQRPTREAVELLQDKPATTVAAILLELSPSTAQELLLAFSTEKRNTINAALPAHIARQWTHNQSYAHGTLGRMMDPAVAVFHPEMSVGDTIESLRDLIRTTFITYCYVTDERGKLVGVITMRDLLFSEKSKLLKDVMLQEIFSLKPEMPLLDAMKLVLNRHYPAYPVCDERGHLVGLVRGQVMFEEQAFELSAQAGSMVGVEKEERLNTPWLRSLKFRHPWLQFNLLTAFVAAAVVGIFQDTINQLVILALFLPVLAGQSGNTGCQALAVTLRGMTLGELKSGKEKILFFKEALLGLLNGTFVGISAGLGMYVVASLQDSPHALILAFVVFLAMIGSCVISGISGALIPMTLKKFGADPATASSIFLTTATDVASMGMFLGLATVLIL